MATQAYKSCWDDSFYPIYVYVMNFSKFVFKTLYILQRHDKNCILNSEIKTAKKKNCTCKGLAFNTAYKICYSSHLKSN